MADCVHAMLKHSVFSPVPNNPKFPHFHEIRCVACNHLVGLFQINSEAGAIQAIGTRLMDIHTAMFSVSKNICDTINPLKKEIVDELKKK